MAAELIYSDAIFSVVFRIDASAGEVDMIEDVALGGELDFVLDKERIPYIGVFDARGEFQRVIEAPESDLEGWQSQAPG